MCLLDPTIDQNFQLLYQNVENYDVDCIGPETLLKIDEFEEK